MLDCFLFLSVHKIKIYLYFFFSVVCNLYSALFSKVIVKINGTEISDPTSNPVPYKSYIENLLNYSKDFQETVLRSAKWVLDKPGKSGRYLTQAAAKTAGFEGEFNQSYVDRREGLDAGGYNEFCIPLPSDIVTAQRYLPPG